MLSEAGTVDDYLKTVWDRIRSAGDLILEMRREKKILAERLSDLEGQFLIVKSEMNEREQELKRLRAERAQLLSGNGNMGFTEDERATLRTKIHDVISKINSHL